MLIGDKGYLSQHYQQDLFETSAIKVETPMRKNQLNFKPFAPALRKARKRIETLFSLLCDQFMLRRNYAKSFDGFSTRILSKMTALTLIQWFNKLNGNNINNLKVAIYYMHHGYVIIFFNVFNIIFFKIKPVLLIKPSYRFLESLFS